MIKNRFIISLYCSLILITNLFSARKITQEDSESIESLNKKLIEAVKSNNLESVKLLVESKADVEARDEYSANSLQWAAQLNYTDIAKFLLESKANIEAKAITTPLHFAANHDSIETAKLLLARGANVNCVDNDLLTPLHGAATKNYTKMAKLLLDNGAITDAKNIYECTPLHYAAMRNSLETAQLLLEHRANIESRSINLETPLYIAAAQNSKKIIKLLLDNKANIESKNKFGNTPLHVAATTNSLGSTQLLLEYNANIKGINEDLYPYLQVAAALSNNTKITQLLLDNKGNIEARDKDGYSLLHHATNNGLLETSQLLLAQGANINAISGPDSLIMPLHAAASKNYTKIAKLLLDNKANIEAQDKSSSTPLHSASFFNSLEVVQLLIENRANIETANSYLATPLHLAALKNNTKVIKFLLDNKANIEAKDIVNCTTLHSAAFDNSLESLRLLLTYGAFINAVSPERGTPLMVASFKNHINIVKELLRQGADRKLLLGEKSCKIIAREKGHLDIVALLETQDKAERYKNDIFIALFGFKNHDIEFIKPNLEQLKKLMLKCTIAVKTPDTKDNVLHILLADGINNFELIIRFIALHPDLLFMPNKLGITPLDIIVTDKQFLLDAMFRIAYGDKYKPRSVESVSTLKKEITSTPSSSSSSSSSDIISLLLKANEKIDKTADANGDETINQVVKKRRTDSGKK